VSVLGEVAKGRGNLSGLILDAIEMAEGKSQLADAVGEVVREMGVDEGPSGMVVCQGKSAQGERAIPHVGDHRIRSELEPETN
jgi:hypothetical protein